MAAVGVGYWLIGLLGQLLAIPPGYATPLYPAAGLALAAVLRYGWRVVPVIGLASCAVNLTVHPPTALDMRPWLGGPLLGCGAALQAWVGAWLAERWMARPITLAEPRDIVRFFGIAAFAASVISASVATATLAGLHVLPSGALLLNWATWWFGDALGVVIGAPVVLTLIGQPRADWAPRRLTVGLTLVLVTSLLGSTVRQVLVWEDERAQAAFDREADSADMAVRFKLEEALHALEAMRTVYMAAEDVDRALINRASASWIRGSGLQAMGYAERVTRPQLADFEAQARHAGQPDFEVEDRPRGKTASRLREPPRGAVMFPIRQIEPLESNDQALGVNLLSIPEAAQALERSIDSGTPTATAAFHLSQDPPDANLAGVVVYHALYDGQTSTAVQRRADVVGSVFVSLHVQRLLAQAMQRMPSFLAACLFDADPAATLRQLAGPPSCAATPQSGYTSQRTLEFAGRHWLMRVDSGAARLPRERGDAWLFAIVGPLACAVLGALLLAVTGRTRRIETAVAERTAALEQEVRERQQAEAALRSSEQRFRNIFNNVPVGVVYTDLDGSVSQTNAAFCDLVGHSADALLAMNVRDYTHPDDVADDRAAVQRLLAGASTTEHRQTRYVLPDGRLRAVSTTVSLLRDERGQPQRIVAAAEDITENLRLADADRARKAAEASNRAKSDFLSRMSHELRTPLNAMLGFAQLLDIDSRHPLDAAQRPWVAQIQQAGWHLLEMINDVLDLSRIESGNLRLAADTLQVATLVATTLPLVQREAQARNVVIVERLAHDAARVVGDSTRVKQILTNLLSNAIKYNVDGGRVHISSRRRGELVDIRVADTGLGMTPEQLAELFQPFNRLGREQTKLPGTGIGLVVSQRLAELMGGALRARSTVGEGSAFTLTLPFVEDPDTVETGLDAPSAVEPAYHRRRVHYVEDNETNVEVMRGILAQRPQVQLDVSTTGLDGLAAIRARRPDVILLDMHLPDISGMELLRHLGRDPQTAAIPVVVVSADAMESQVVQAEALNAYRYLTKPVDVAQLLGVLDGLLNDTHTRFG